MSSYQFDGFPGFNEPTFTLTPDILFDELAPDLVECELRVLLYIVRRTFGFKKSADSISINQMVEGIKTRDGRILDRGTGMSRPSVVKGAKGLAEKGIIIATANRNPDGGDAPTTYQLRFRTTVDTQVGGLTNLTPPSKAPLPPGVNRLNPQVEAVEQDPVTQDTEDTTYLSKPILDPTSNFRNGSTREEKRGKDASNDVGRPQEVDGNRAVDRTPAGTRKPPHRRALEYPRERQIILSYLRDFSLELGDRAPLRSTVTRAYNLFQESGLSLDDFIAALLEARSITKERTSAIHGEVGRKNKAPYFFACLEDVLGLREDDQRSARFSSAPTVGDGPGDVAREHRRDHQPAPRRSTLGPYRRVVPLESGNDDGPDPTLEGPLEALQSQKRGRREPARRFTRRDWHPPS
jgi:hypothetical protein